MPKKANKAVLAETIEAVRSAASELGISDIRPIPDTKEDRLRLAIQLDERAYTTPNGGKFHRGNRPEGLDRFVKAHMPEGLPAFRPEQEQATTPKVANTTERRATTGDVPPTTPDIPHDTEDGVSRTESLSGDELATLRRIIEWWSTGGEATVERLKGVNVESLVTKPSFPGKKVNSGIRVNEALFRAAVEKCKTSEEAPKTGGSLSGLLEVLLWSYLENDPLFLEEPKSPSQEDTEADRPVDTTSVRV